MIIEKTPCPRMLSVAPAAGSAGSGSANDAAWVLLRLGRVEPRSLILALAPVVPHWVAAVLQLASWARRITHSNNTVFDMYKQMITAKSTFWQKFRSAVDW